MRSGWRIAGCCRLSLVPVATTSTSRIPRCRRNLSTGPHTAIFVSDSNDPYFNLAFEDWIFRKMDPEQIVLYLYRNRPSVIIGRNQNPWKEIDLHRLRDLDIPFVRRKSGGGTVYHDLGNTNYCVYVPRLQFERRINAELVARALVNLHIPAQVNERNDICVEGFKMSSAFKLVNARAYHHGTMLIDAKLGNLRGVLGNDKDKMVAKGVASVSSPVRNLRDWSVSIDHDEFVEAVADEFVKSHGASGVIQRIDEAELERNNYVREVRDELMSWEWKYGQTPEFTHELNAVFDGSKLSLRIKTRHALITEAEGEMQAGGDEMWKSTLDELTSRMIGDRYSTLEQVESQLSSSNGSLMSLQNRGRRILDWLREAM